MTRRPDTSPRRYGQVFDEIAADYDRHRPAYPDALIDRACQVARLAPEQRQALEREHAAICARLGRPLRASTVAALVTARRA